MQQSPIGLLLFISGGTKATGGGEASGQKDTQRTRAFGKESIWRGGVKRKNGNSNPF